MIWAWVCSDVFKEVVTEKHSARINLFVEAALTFCHKSEDRAQFGIFRVLYVGIFDQVFEEKQVTGTSLYNG